MRALAKERGKEKEVGFSRAETLGSIRQLGGCAITERAVEPMRKPNHAVESTGNAVERDPPPGQPSSDQDSSKAAAGLPGEDASRYCPVCSHRLESMRCKLVCTVCGYYMSCADYY